MKKLFLAFVATGSLALALTNNCPNGGGDPSLGCGGVNAAFTNLTVGGNDALPGRGLIIADYSLVPPAGSNPIIGGLSPSMVDVCGGNASFTAANCATSSGSAVPTYIANLLTPGTNFGISVPGVSSGFVTSSSFVMLDNPSFFQGFDFLDAPEPSTIGLVGLSLAALGLLRSRLRRKS